MKIQRGVRAHRERVRLFAFMIVLSAGMLLGASGCELESEMGNQGETVQAASHPLLPDEVQLIHIDTDAQANAALEMRGVFDSEQKLIALRTVSTRGNRRDFSTTELRNGLVLLSARGRNIVTLSSQNFSGSEGGTIKMTYLYSGITDTYKDFTMDLAREGQNWFVSTETRGIRRRFTEMFLEKNDGFFGVVGIERVTVR